MKTCKKCKIHKNLEEFYKHPGYKGGFLNKCKICSNKDSRSYNETNKNRIKQYRLENKEKIARTRRLYRLNNRDKIAKSIREYNSKRRKSDINFKLRTNLRTRLNMAIKRGSKAGSAVKDLGCSIVELRTYLETKFLAGMTWDNYGSGPGKWEIDHIYPLSRCDLTDRDEFLKACRYTNLQPMWSVDNLKKRNKLLEIKD